MRLLFKIQLLLAAAQLGSCSPAASVAKFGAFKVKESIADLPLPKGWSVQGSPAPGTIIPLSIGLKQQNIDQIIELLHDRANPDSPNFRKWLTVEQTNNITRPAAATITAVKEWLVLNGISASAINNDSPGWIQLNLPVEQVESLLNTKYSFYTHPNRLQNAPRALSYSLPQNLHDLIDTVQPTTVLDAPVNANAGKLNSRASKLTAEIPTRVERRASGTVTCVPTTINPSCIRGYYSVDWQGSNRQNAQVGAYLGGSSANLTDASLFNRFFATGGLPVSTIAINGQTNPGTADVEGNLDTQMISSIGAANQAYFITGNDYGDPFSQFAAYLSNTQADNPPRSISMSLLVQEPTGGAPNLVRTCNDFATAGLNGVTVMVASGDDGVSSSPMSNGQCSVFAPSFPSTCPYVTSVGASDFKNAQTFTIPGTDPGLQASWFGSTGGTGAGFSNLFSRPSFQQNAVETYRKNTLAPTGLYNGLYNLSGRAYPDISAFGDQFNIVYNGGPLSGVAGTSAASPIFAGLVSLLNDFQASQSQPTLGWLNPYLYSDRGVAGLKDVSGQSSRTGCMNYGFPATSGWDPATGLGVMNFATFRQLLSK